MSRTKPANPLMDIDFYKSGHHRQYPAGTEFVYSNFTARSAHLANIPENARDGVIFFGLSHYIQSVLIDRWNAGFFQRDRDEVCNEYKRRLDHALGGDNDVSHIYRLHEHGVMPLRIKALQEGCLVPVGVPMLTIENTHSDFFWLTNFLETSLSACLWKPIVTATTARYFRRLCEHAGRTSCDTIEHVDFQCHDFSMRGMSGIADAALSGAAHLIFFKGTDTVPAISLIEDYYAGSAGLIGASVPATEHSVMSMGGEGEGEFETFRRLICETYPTGILSIVSDTWDFWRVLTNFMPRLKDAILARDGKLVIRPDSGDPVKIICGDPDAPEGSAQRRGAIEVLGETFGFLTNSKGYRSLCPKVGLIYGDSITPDRCEKILSRLMDERLIATDSVVFGVGSYTYQMVTRDTWGMAVKATFGRVNGADRMIFKKPKTDSGSKNSLRGRVFVYQGADGDLAVEDGLRFEAEGCLLEPVFHDGVIMQSPSFDFIRSHAAQWI